METRYIGDVIYIHMKQDIIIEKRVSLSLLCGVQHSVTFIMLETQEPIIVIILIIVSYYFQFLRKQQSYKQLCLVCRARASVVFRATPIN